MNYFDFNDVIGSNTTDLIPAGFITKVRLNIKKGNYTDSTKGWYDGYPTKNFKTGAIFLNCSFTVIGNKYSKYKIWSLIGIYSDKNDNKWGDFGRNFICNILNSAKKLAPNDLSEQAKIARKIKDFGDLDNLEFVVRIGIKKDTFGVPKNVVGSVITKGHKEYQNIINGNVSQNIGGAR